MEISEDTRDVIRQLLRSYRKGYAFDFYDYADNIGMPANTLGVILADLCELGNEDFFKVTVLEGRDVVEAGKRQIEQWKAS